MTKTQSAGLATHFSQTVTTIADYWKVIWRHHQPKIIDITQANPGVFTTRWSHSLKTGDKVKIVDVDGMTEVNKNEYTITALDGISFSIDADTSAFSVYVNGGEARKVFGFTSNPKDTVFDGVNYKAKSGYTASALSARADLSVDDLELQGLIDSDDIKIRDIESGRWADADIETFQLNYENLADGKMDLPATGNLGEHVIKRPGLYVAELLGLQAHLQQQIGDLYSILCRARLGDTKCKVRLDPPRWRATTAYTVRPASDAGLGDVVRPTAYNDRQFKCTTAGTSGVIEPAWDTTIGNTTADGAPLVWTAIDTLTKESTVSSVTDSGQFKDNARIEPPAASYLFPIVAVSTSSGRFDVSGDRSFFFFAGKKFRVTGSSGNDKVYTTSSAPYNAGSDKTEITVIQIDPQAKEIPDGTADGKISISDSGWFTFGLLTFLNGANTGIGMEVKNYTFTSYAIVAVDQGAKKFEISGDHTGFFGAGEIILVTVSTGKDGRYTVASSTYNGGSDRTEITVSETIPDATVDGDILQRPAEFLLFTKFPFSIGVGESFQVEAGCDKFLGTCIGKFDNNHNFRAEPFIPGVDEMLVVPSPG